MLAFEYCWKVMHLTILVCYWFNCVEIKLKLQQRVVVLFVLITCTLQWWGSIFNPVYINMGKNSNLISCSSIQAGFCFVLFLVVFGRNCFLFCLLKSLKWQSPLELFILPCQKNTWFHDDDTHFMFYGEEEKWHDAVAL